MWEPLILALDVMFSGTGNLRGVSPRAGIFIIWMPQMGGALILPFLLSLGHLVYVPLSPGQHRLGGTALAQCFSQLGNQPPNLDLPENLVQAFNITQGLLRGQCVCRLLCLTDYRSR